MTKHGPDTDGIGVDAITDALRQCELALRTLQDQGRLTDGAMKHFVEFAATVRSAVERRGGGDRRQHLRTSIDRRSDRRTPGGRLTES